MKISGLQKLSLVDFDGHISATIFTAGCNFACPYCHNAGLVNGTEPIIPTQEVLDYLEKRKNVLDAVCISGGEPTLHHDLPEFISKIKSMGYKVKLDTNGTNLQMLKYLVGNNLIDYIAMDIKNSPEKYGITINCNNIFSPKESTEYIMNCGVDYEFRTTLVDGFHTEEDMIKIGKLINGANKYCLQKFEDSGNCLKTGLSAIDNNTVRHFQDIMNKYTKSTILRGY
jgi:pyruvate formate lyase activating enzyme